MPLAVAPSGSL